MTSDPERILSAVHADPLERELLDSVRHVGPPQGAKDQAWRGITAQIAIAAAVGVATGSSTAAAAKAGAGSLASWGVGAKVGAVVAASGLALGGGYAALQATHGDPPPSVAPRTVVVAPPVVRAQPPAVLEAPGEPAPVVSGDDAPARKLEPRRQDLLKAESALLTEARAQLRSGNAAGAQASLERLQAQFPKGMLAQEREVLAVEVLHARGNVEGAKRRAQAFIKAYPKSPHSARLSRFAD